MLTINERLIKKIGKYIELYNHRNPNDPIDLKHQVEPMLKSADYFVGIYDDWKIDMFSRTNIWKKFSNNNLAFDADVYNGYFTRHMAVYVHQDYLNGVRYELGWQPINSYYRDRFVTCNIQKFVPLDEVRTDMFLRAVIFEFKHEIKSSQLEEVLKYAETYFAKKQEENKKIR